jgi:hypothetical protein
MQPLTFLWFELRQAKRRLNETLSNPRGVATNNRPAEAERQLRATRSRQMATSNETDPVLMRTG